MMGASGSILMLFIGWASFSSQQGELAEVQEKQGAFVEDVFVPLVNDKLAKPNGWNQHLLDLQLAHLKAQNV